MIAVALRMSKGEAEADRRAVIEDVDRISLEADGLGEGIDDLGQIIEGVFELRPTRGIRETKAQPDLVRLHGIDLRAVGSDRGTYVTIGKPCNSKRLGASGSRPRGRRLCVHRR
jgi:hypothetical protein